MTSIPELQYLSRTITKQLNSEIKLLLLGWGSNRRVLGLGLGNRVIWERKYFISFKEHEFCISDTAPDNYVEVCFLWLNSKTGSEFVLEDELFQRAWTKLPILVWIIISLVSLIIKWHFALLKRINYLVAVKSK